MSDAEAVRESVRDASLFAVVYRRHLEAVGRYLARRVGDEMAEDLTAEVFVRAVAGAAGYRPDHATALPWLLGIASNLIGDHRRAERRRLLALQRLVSGAPEMVAHEAAGLAPDLVRQLRRLSASDRDALLLVVWGELSYEEAASALGIPPGTVRSRIARARQQLSTAIGVDTRPGGSAMTNGEAHV